MLLDKQNLFSDGQAVTADAGSTNIIDLGTERRIGTGEPINVAVCCVADMTDAASNSLCTVTLECDDDVAFGSPEANPQVIGVFPALSVAGALIVARLRPLLLNKRYIRLKYTMTNGDLTTGSFTAGLVKDFPGYASFPSGSTIS